MLREELELLLVSVDYRNVVAFLVKVLGKGRSDLTAADYDDLHFITFLPAAGNDFMCL